MGLTNLKARLGGTVGNDEGAENVINQLTDLIVQASKAADDGGAANATADTLLWTNPFDFSVVMVSARYTPTTGAITGDNTNNAVITLKSNDGAGGSTAVGLSITTDVATGNFSTNQSKAFTSQTPAGAVIPAGGGLWLNIAKGGSGVVVRAGLLNVRLRRVS
jgi:hypothetical protein